MPTYKVKVREFREYAIVVNADDFHQASNEVMEMVEAQQVSPAHTDLHLVDVEFLSASDIAGTEPDAR